MGIQPGIRKYSLKSIPPVSPHKYQENSVSQYMAARMTKTQETLCLMKTLKS